MPVVKRTITVDGDACAKPQNLIVPVGTAYEDVLNAAGIKGGVELGKVVAGGAMMGPAVENLSYPTTKTTSGLIMLSAAAAEPPQVNPCIRCGRCVEYCPMGLEPVEVTKVTLPATFRSWASCMLITASTAAPAPLSARQSAPHPDDGPGKGVLPW